MPDYISPDDMKVGDKVILNEKTDKLEESIINSAQYITDEALLEKIYEEQLIKYQEYS